MRMDWAGTGAVRCGAVRCAQHDRDSSVGQWMDLPSSRPFHLYRYRRTVPRHLLISSCLLLFSLLTHSLTPHRHVFRR